MPIQKGLPEPLVGNRRCALLPTMSVVFNLVATFRRSSELGNTDIVVSNKLCIGRTHGDIGGPYAGKSSHESWTPTYLLPTTLFRTPCTMLTAIKMWRPRFWETYYPAIHGNKIKSVDEFATG